MLEYAADHLGWIVAICGALGTLSVMARRASKKASAGVSRFNQVTDVLLGRPAILHPDTGEELVPETPGIGTRMAHMEKWQERTDGILETLANTQSELVRTNRRVDQLGDKLNRHLDNGCTHAPSAHVEVKVEQPPI